LTIERLRAGFCRVRPTCGLPFAAMAHAAGDGANVVTVSRNRQREITGTEPIVTTAAEYLTDRGLTNSPTR
jgi:hypothetical protein